MPDPMAERLAEARDLPERLREIVTTPTLGRRLKAAAQRIEDLEAALRLYGRHRPDCVVVHAPMHDLQPPHRHAGCNCGWQALLDVLDGRDPWARPSTAERAEG